MAARYTPDGSHDDVPTLASADGQAAITAVVHSWVSGVAGLTRYPRGAFGAGACATVEQEVWGTNQGRFPGERGVAFQVYVVTVFALKGNRIHRSADSDDRATILTQLGTGPAPGTPPGG